jgi:hypothetical protein
MTTEQHFTGREKVEEKYNSIFGEKHHEICEGVNCQCHKEVKDFIFNEVILEVLRNVMPKCKEKGMEAKYYFYKIAQKEIKEKAKELYNISL